MQPRQAVGTTVAVVVTVPTAISVITTHKACHATESDSSSFPICGCPESNRLVDGQFEVHFRPPTRRVSCSRPL
ncbi:hypothetical protein DER45DRAFT_572026, partial [Fusarium avenaceum]